jgi:hypothetical protein
VIVEAPPRTACAPADGRCEAFVQALIEAGADAPFNAEGLIFFYVPLWVVKAYAQARYDRSDIAMALASAVIGESDAKLLRADPAKVIWTLVRAWTARLGQLERRVREPARGGA